MNEKGQQSSDDIGQHVQGLSEAIDQGIALLRALTPLSLRLDALRAAIAEFAAATGRVESPVVAPTRAVGEPPLVTHETNGTPAGEYDSSAAASLMPVQFVPGAAQRGTSPPRRQRSSAPELGEGVAAAQPQPVTVTIRSENGVLDLGHIYSALEAVPGVTGLALVSYTRGRAALRLDTGRAAADLPIADALGSVLEADVSIEQTGPDELSVTLGA